MMQAIKVVPKEFKEFKKREEVKKKSDDGPPCSKWNFCDAQGKYTYEVENPGKTCF